MFWGKIFNKVKLITTIVFYYYNILRKYIQIISMKQDGAGSNIPVIQDGNMILKRPVFRMGAGILNFPFFRMEQEKLKS